METAFLFSILSWSLSKGWKGRDARVFQPLHEDVLCSSVHM